MLQFALATLLALQAASGSPNAAPPGPPAVLGPQSADRSRDADAGAPRPDLRHASEAQPAAPATPGRAARTTPTPGPRPTPTPAKASGDLLVVVNKSDSTALDPRRRDREARGRSPVETGPHEVEGARRRQDRRRQRATARRPSPGAHRLPHRRWPAARSSPASTSATARGRTGSRRSPTAGCS